MTPLADGDGAVVTHRPSAGGLAPGSSASGGLAPGSRQPDPPVQGPQPGG